MKSEIVMNAEDQKERTYPWIGESIKEKMLVLFTGEKAGVVINKGKQEFWGIGCQIDYWEMSCFKEFKGKVLLSND